MAHPSQWVTDFTTNHAAFKNWEVDNKLEVSALTADAIKEKCGTDKDSCAATGSCPSCDGCSIAVSRVFKTYEAYLNSLFAATFKTHSEAMFNRLHEANLALEA